MSGKRKKETKISLCIHPECKSTKGKEYYTYPKFTQTTEQRKLGVKDATTEPCYSSYETGNIKQHIARHIGPEVKQTDPKVEIYRIECDVNDLLLVGDKRQKLNPRDFLELRYETCSLGGSPIPFLSKPPNVRENGQDLNPYPVIKLLQQPCKGKLLIEMKLFKSPLNKGEEFNLEESEAFEKKHRIKEVIPNQETKFDNVVLRLDQVEQCPYYLAFVLYNHDGKEIIDMASPDEFTIQEIRVNNLITLSPTKAVINVERNISIHGENMKRFEEKIILFGERKANIVFCAHDMIVVRIKEDTAGTVPVKCDSIQLAEFQWLGQSDDNPLSTITLFTAELEDTTNNTNTLEDNSLNAMNFPLKLSLNLEDLNRKIASGINVNCADRKGYTALHYAYMHHQIPVAEMLISKGAIMNYPANNGLTPQHFKDLYVKHVTKMVDKPLDPQPKLDGYSRLSNWIINYLKQSGKGCTSEELRIAYEKESNKKISIQLIEVLLFEKLIPDKQISASGDNPPVFIVQ